ncbi:MAG: hypothetical protein V4507_11205 [Verrucomicrobiota bacterium]
MRTTIDINDALLRELRETAQEMKKPFRYVLEATLQRGLSLYRSKPKATRIKIKPRPVGIKPAVRSMSMNQLYDQIESES